MSQNQTIIAIDIGNNYTKIVYYDEEHNTIIPIVDTSGNSFFPSILSFDSYQPLKTPTTFENEAKKQFQNKYRISGVKRLIGTTIDNIQEELFDKISYDIEDSIKNMYSVFINDTFNNSSQFFSPEEIIAIQLQHIKRILLNHIQNPDFENIILTVPTYFTDSQIEILKKAFEIVELNVITVLKESSVVIYECQKNHQIDDGNILIVDIGETTDISIVSKINDEIQYISSQSDIFLGGSDFDEIIDELIIELLIQKGYPLNYFKEVKNETIEVRNKRLTTLYRLRNQSEKVKIELSSKENVVFEIDEILQKEDILDEENITITREEFEQKIQEKFLLDKIRNLIEKTLSESKSDLNQIEKVIVYGGTTCIPCIQRMIENYFGKEKILPLIENDKLMIVAKSACRYTFDNKDKINEQPKIETIPESIGVVTQHGRNNFIARKGDKVPAYSEKRLMTTNINQRSVIFKFVMGESNLGEFCELLFQISVELPESSINQHRELTLITEITRSGFLIVSVKTKDDDDKEVYLINDKFHFKILMMKINHKNQFIRRNLEQYFPD